MARGPDDAERRRLKAEYRKAERDEARSRMVLEPPPTTFSPHLMLPRDQGNL